MSADDVWHNEIGCYCESGVTSDTASREQRAKLALEKCATSREISHRRYKPVTLTIGDAEALARDVLALLSELAAAREERNREQRDRNFWAANNSRERQRLEAELATARQENERLFQEMEHPFDASEFAAKERELVVAREALKFYRDASPEDFGCDEGERARAVLDAGQETPA